MKKHLNLSLFSNIMFIIWIWFCICLFILFSAHISYIQSIELKLSALTWESLRPFFTPIYWANLIISFFGMTLFTLSCIMVGKALMEAVHFQSFFESQTETQLARICRIATYFIIGYFFISIILVIIVGYFRLITEISWGVLVFGVILGLFKRKEIFSGIKTVNTIHNFSIFNKLTWLMVGCALLTASARISYDSSAIYFSDAKLVAHTGKFGFFTDGTFVASVMQSVLPQTILLQTFGDQSARMIAWISGLLVLILCLGLGEKVGLTKHAQSILPIILLTSTAFFDLLGDGKVDLSSTAPAIAAIYWLVTLKSSHKVSSLIIVGLLCGISISMRPFNAFLFVIFISMYFIHQAILVRFSGEFLKEIFGSLIWISFGVGILGIFHLFVNWVLYKDFFAFIKSLAAINSASGPWDNASNAIFWLRALYPLMATFRNSPQSLGNISPLVIGFIPGIFLDVVRNNLRISNKLKHLTWYAGVTIFAWLLTFFTVVEIRYVLFLWLILFLPASEIIASFLDHGEVLLRKYGFVSIIFLSTMILIRTVLISGATYSPINLNKSPICSDYTACTFFQSINKIASSGERVLMLSPYRYYLREDLLYCSSQYQDYSKLQSLSQSIDHNLFWEQVYQLGFKYIAFENDYTTRHLQFGLIPTPDNTPEWLSLKRIDYGNGTYFTAYEIQVIKPPVQVQYRCDKNDLNIWEIHLYNE